MQPNRSKYKIPGLISGLILLLGMGLFLGLSTDLIETFNWSLISVAIVASLLLVFGLSFIRRKRVEQMPSNNYDTRIEEFQKTFRESTPTIEDDFVPSEKFASKTNFEVRFCNYCGIKLEYEKQFCSNCGKKLT